MNNPLVQPDPGLYIWTILTFLVLLALLAKYAWKPLLEALDNRQQSIRKALDDARKAKQELEAIHAESAKLLARARMRRQHLIAIAAALAGAALFTYAVRRAGVADIIEAIQRVGWGLVLILAVAGLRFLVRAECWRWCLPPAVESGFSRTAFP